MATAAERRAILEKEAAAHQQQRRRRRAATGDRDRRYRHRPTPTPEPAATPGGPSWWCVIAAAEHFEWDGQPPYEVRREMADAAGLDPWAGAA